MNAQYHLYIAKTGRTDDETVSVLEKHADECVDVTSIAKEGGLLATGLPADQAEGIVDRLRDAGVEAELQVPAGDGRTETDEKGTAVARIDDRHLQRYRLRLNVTEPVTIEKSQLFTNGSAAATWRIDDDVVAKGDEFVFDPSVVGPGRHELVVDVDGRRTRRELTIGTDVATLTEDADEVLYLVVFKTRRKLYFQPIYADSERADLSSRREAVRAEQQRGEPASFEFAHRQNDQWETGVLPEPMIDYRSVREGIYALVEEDLYFVADLDVVSESVDELKRALDHDATVDDVADAEPAAVFQAISDLSVAFHEDGLRADGGRFVTRPNYEDGGVFDRFVTRNVGVMVEHLGDHMAAMDVDLRQDRIGALVGFNTQNFTLTTRFSNPDLGVSRQYTDMLGFGSGGGRESIDGFTFGPGGTDKGTAGFGFGIGPNGGIDLGAKRDAALGLGRVGPAGFGSRGDGEQGNDLGFGGVGQSGGGRIPLLGMAGDGDGFSLGFNDTTGRGSMFEDRTRQQTQDGGGSGGGLVGPFDEDGYEADDSGRVLPVPFSTRRDGPEVSYTVVKEDGSVETWYFYDTAHDDGQEGTDPQPDGTDPEPDGGGGGDGSDGSGGDDTPGGDEPEGGSGNGGEEPEGGDEPGGGDEPEGDDPETPDEPEDGDDEPSGGGEVGLTPNPTGPGGGGRAGRGSGSIPFGRIGGMSGGCRGGGYTDPNDGATGAAFGALHGVVCPMGGEPGDGLTQPLPGEGDASRGGIDPEKLMLDLLGALTQPGSSDAFLAEDASGVGIVGHVDSEAFADPEVDPTAGDTEEPVVPDGGRDIDSATASPTTLFRLADATTAESMGMDDTERLVGTVDGREATGLFGFTGTLRVDDAA